MRFCLYGQDAERLALRHGQGKASVLPLLPFLFLFEKSKYPHLAAIFDWQDLSPNLVRCVSRTLYVPLLCG